jgi:hypothetical protein
MENETEAVAVSPLAHISISFHPLVLVVRCRSSQPEVIGRKPISQTRHHTAYCPPPPISPWGPSKMDKELDKELDEKLMKELIAEERQLRTALTNAPPPEPITANTPGVTQVYEAHIKADVQRAAERARLNIHRAYKGKPRISSANWAEMEEEEDAKVAAEAEAMASAHLEDDEFATKVMHEGIKRFPNKRERRTLRLQPKRISAFTGPSSLNRAQGIDDFGKSSRVCYII